MGEIIKFLIWSVIEFLLFFPNKRRPKDKNNGANSEENRKTVEKP